MYRNRNTQKNATPIYDKLLSMPLFQGMTRGELEHIVATARLDFKTVQPCTPIVAEYEPCDRLIFIIDGTIKVQTYADDRSFSLIETLSAPQLLQPERLFGLTQHFTHTFSADTLCHLFAISKSDIVNFIHQSEIFRINIMNTISARCQRSERTMWRHGQSTTRRRIVKFLSDHCMTHHGEKEAYIVMNVLAREVNDSRREVSDALKQLKADGLLTLERGHIIIPNMEKLLD